MASYIDLQKLNKIDKTLFTTLDIARFLGIDNQRNLENLIKRLISENVLTILEKGKYYLTDKSPSTFEIAQFLYNPSYISFETALNYHGLLSQFPFEISSATTKKRTEKEIEGKVYTYSKMDKSLFTGYYLEKDYLIATKEKALFDEIYMISKSLRSEKILENIEFDQIDKTKLLEFRNLLSSNSVGRFNNLLKRYIL
ncbi:MAG: hypothetical protein O2871_02685 [bacterium]|nr:hypothetical protein [bacterium]